MTGKTRSRVLVAAATAGALVALSPAAALASSGNTAKSDPLVFVQSNSPHGNHVIVFRRGTGGRLTRLGSTWAGGYGGRLSGAVVDPLASQDSLVYDTARHLLVGVNAGSNTLFAFTVSGDRLTRRQVVGSGGTFPVSVTVHGNLLYVLNAKGAGSVFGYRIGAGNRLHTLTGAARSLHLTPVTGSTEFLNTAGDVAFTPDGHYLVVTTKDNGSRIDVFSIGRNGRPSGSFVANPATTPVPFAITFAGGRLVVGEAGTSALSTYVVDGNGRLDPVASTSDGQQALCWVARGRGYYFVSNAGSATESGFRIGSNGHPSVVSRTTTGAGPIDAAVSGARFIYVEAGGAGAVDEFGIQSDGALTRIATVTGLPGLEGIAATG